MQFLQILIGILIVISSLVIFYQVKTMMKNKKGRKKYLKRASYIQTWGPDGAVGDPREVPPFFSEEDEEDSPPEGGEVDEVDGSEPTDDTFGDRLFEREGKWRI